MSTADKVVDILMSRHNGKRTGNRIQSHSPYRADSDGLSFSLTIHDGEHGAWKDFSADTGGSLYELAEHLGIETPKRVPVESSLREYRGLADYAQSKGVHADVFANAKWVEGVYMNRPALQFPTAGGIRYRFLDGNKPKFISEKGYTACLYGLKGAPKIADNSGLPLILTNGEPSVIVAQWYGLPAVCKTSGEARLPQALLDELITTWRGAFIIGLDCDDTGRKASAQIATQLTDLGRVAVVVDLGLGDKGDLADFCRLHADGTLSAFTERVKLATPYVKPDATADKIADLANALGDVKRAIADSKPNDLPVVIERAQATLDALALDTIAPKTMTSIQVLSSLGAMIERGFDGIETGLFDFDRLLGGVPNGAVTVLYGATGMGKSSLTASVCANWERAGRTGIYITTELKPEKFMLKVVSCMTGIPTKAFYQKVLPREDNARHREALAQLAKNNSQFIDAISPSMAQLKSQVRRAVDSGASFVIVDSMSKLALANDYTATATAHNVILDLARETNLPFLVTSQVGRAISGRADKIPQLDDAYGGGVIEQNASNVIAVYRHEYYTNLHLAEENEREYPKGTARLVYLKTRDGGHAGMYSTLLYREDVGFFNLVKDEVF